MCIYLPQHEFMCTICSGTCGVQKRTLDPLELELEAVVNSHVGAGTIEYS